ncbi:UNVERIFIED_ORG: hypothetical protein GGD47_003464 [Rhizobium etli]
MTRAEAQLKIYNSPQRVSRIKPLLRHAAGLSFGIVLELRRQLLRRLCPCAPVVRLRPAVGLIKLSLAEIVPISDPQRFIDPAGIDPSSDRDVGNIAVSFSNLPPREIFLRHKARLLF